MKKLLAGPWIGEFGWELFCWQGFVRKESRKYDHTTIICRPGHQVLYQDFADEIIEFDPKSYKTEMHRCFEAESHMPLVNSINYDQWIDGTRFNMGYTNVNGVRKSNHDVFEMQEFFKYQSNKNVQGYDIVMHGRSKSTGNERNWSKENWDKLADICKDSFSICCIGNEEAFKIEGVDDKRCVPLEELVGIMSSSKLVVGPSSGPMHLASLCGTKHLVWSINANYHRYTEDWNPLNTDVIFYDKEDWQPNVNNIKKLIYENFNGSSV